jgi:hypothetical protein
MKILISVSAVTISAPLMTDSDVSLILVPNVESTDPNLRTIDFRKEI